MISTRTRSFPTCRASLSLFHKGEGVSLCCRVERVEDVCDNEPVTSIVQCSCPEVPVLEPPGPIDPKLPYLAADPPYHGRHCRITAVAMRYRCGNTTHPRDTNENQSTLFLQLAEARLQAELPAFQRERVVSDNGSRSEGRHGPEILLSLEAGLGAGLGCVKR